jgi:hypothetical protein
MNVLMAILLQQLHFNLRTEARLLRLHLHPRQRPQAVLSPNPMTLRPSIRLRLPRIRLRPPRIRLRLQLLLRLPPRKLVAVVVVVVAATTTSEACTCLGVSFLIYSPCLSRATFFYQNGNAGACGQVHQDTDMICAIGECSLGPTQ